MELHIATPALIVGTTILAAWLVARGGGTFKFHNGPDGTDVETRGGDDKISHPEDNEPHSANRSV